MRKCFKKIVIYLTIVLVLLSSSVTTASAENQIKVYLNNSQVEFDVNPQIINGRTYVPIRAIFESLGGTVWYGGPYNNSVFGNFPATFINMSNDDGIIYTRHRITGSGYWLKFDTPPYTIVNSRALVPIRALAESLTVKVTWDNNTRTIYLVSDKNMGLPIKPTDISAIDSGVAYNQSQLDILADKDRKLGLYILYSNLFVDEMNYVTNLTNNANITYNQSKSLTERTLAVDLFMKNYAKLENQINEINKIDLSKFSDTEKIVHNAMLEYLNSSMVYAEAYRLSILDFMDGIDATKHVSDVSVYAKEMKSKQDIVLKAFELIK